MHQHTAAPLDGLQQGKYALRLTRVPEGGSVTVRCLSKAIDGCMTHYVGSRTHYCPGERSCLPANHKKLSAWKGYIACELWDAKSSLYYPTVLEVTEYAEVEMRGRYQRGQLWRLTRAADKDGVPQPCVPRLLGEHCGDALQPAFMLAPVLCAIFRRSDVRLGVSNPMPPRVIVEAVKGEPPPDPALSPTEALKIKAEEQEQLRKLKARMFKEGNSQGGNNGRDHQ